jgi:hypothetical protein
MKNTTKGRELPKTMAKKVVKEATPKKAVNKVADKKTKKVEKPRIGFIKVDVKIYDSHTENRVEINGITTAELIDICLDMMTRATGASKSNKKITNKKTK